MLKLDRVTMIFRFIGLFIFLIPICSNAYAPPIGIPDPGFGIDEVRPDRPSNWSSEVPGYYYVNLQTGSDSNTFGTPASPRSTIPNPVPAGSYVEVHGTYNHTRGGSIMIDARGTSGAWVANTSGPAWIVGESQTNRAEFTSASIMATGSYLYFDAVYLHSGSKISFGSATAGYSASYGVFRNSEIEGRLSDGNGTLATANGSSSDPTDHIIYYNNRFHDTGDMSSPLDIDAHVMGVGGYTSNVWFLENQAYNASGAGMQVNGRPPSSETHHIYAGKNEVYNVRQAGLWVKYGRDVVFSENHIHHIYLRGGKGIGGQYEPLRLWILYNKLHNLHYGIRIASTTGTAGTINVYAIGNLIYDIETEDGFSGNSSWDNAAIHLHGATNRYVVNNTIYNAPSGINGSSTAGTYYLYDNIVSEVNRSEGNHIWIEYAHSAAQLENMTVFQLSGQERIKWGSNVYSLADFQYATGKGANSNANDPRFANTVTRALNIVAGSSAEDRGVKHPVYDEFQRQYGLNIYRDIQGKVRDTQPDHGAYEVGEGRAPPEAPTLLTN